MERLASRLESNECEPFIRQVRFPNLKNLEPGLTINFDHPLTALVGPNGTNKTTILRALQGCPRGMDLGQHWFETGLDSVELEAARYIHSYALPSGAMAEVIKTRVARTDRRVDYFETRAPRISDGMPPMPDTVDPVDEGYRSKTRWNPVVKEVLYLDFRHTVPAFDIHFLFNHAHRENSIEKKKALVRRRSRRLAEAIAQRSGSYEFYGRDRILEPVEELSSGELEAVSRILGRDYESIQIVAHDFFDVEGRTALIRARGLRYSEAFAGSGEFAAIVLVHQLSKVAERSLVLLDEPETSLHPRAQEALLNHIARTALQKGLQVVLSTHSPALVAMLPSQSVKVLDLAESGKVRLVSESATHREAFSRIGANIDKAAVYVEDELAREILLRAARTKGADALDSLSISPMPGGASSILSFTVPVLAAADARCMVVLDGDQRPQKEILRSTELSGPDVSAQLKKIGIATRLRDSDEGSNAEKHSRRERQLNDWCFSHLRYLPGDCPENLLLEMIGERKRDSSKAAKEFWLDAARVSLGLEKEEYPPASDVLFEQRRRLAEVPNDSPVLAQIIKIVEETLSL